MTIDQGKLKNIFGKKHIRSMVPDVFHLFAIREIYIYFFQGQTFKQHSVLG